MSDKEAQKRRSHVIRATPVVTQLPVSWNSVLVRQQRARKQHNTSAASTNHITPLHDIPSSPHNTSADTTVNSKMVNNDMQDTVSWWSALIGYTLGAVYNSYSEVKNYVMGSDNPAASSDDDCDPNSILITDPVLLARKCLNRNKNDENVKLSPLFSRLSLRNEITSIISRVVDTMKCYTGSPVPISLFEDALLAVDYDGTLTLLPAGTIVQWSPQHYSSTTGGVHLEVDDNWQLVHHSNDTSLYTRPYRDTELSQYRGTIV